MKTMFVLLIAITISATGFTQDFGKDLKKAARNIGSYNLDPSNNADKLTEAIQLIDGVVANDEFKKSSKAWLIYGKAYSELINKDVRIHVLNSEYEMQHTDACSKVWTGFKSAYDFAQKGYEQKDALKGLKTILNNMSYVSNTILRAAKYEEAYHAYTAVVKGDEFLSSNGEDSAFPSEKELNDQVYLTGIAALSAMMFDEAQGPFDRLYKAGYDDAAVYDGLFKIRTEQGDTTGASLILAEGREKYPDDKGLLFAMINEALQKGNADIALDNLKVAVEKEPDNVSVRATLGNVYDQLYTEALEDGDKEVAHGYYQNAKKYFNMALELEEDHFDAIYMMGALEYNFAAEIANEVNELAEDYSKEGTAKYETKKAEMMAQFDLAMPYFLHAEKLNGNDLNTLIALREIYARKNMFDLSNEYKDKIDRISEGQ